MLTIAFDDGLAEHFSIGVPLLNEHGWRGSFYVVPSFVGHPGPIPQIEMPRGYSCASWSMIQDAAASGHEIGSHSMSHPEFEDLPDSVAATREWSEAWMEFVEHLGHPPRTCAWPYGRIGFPDILHRWHPVRPQERVRYYGGLGFSWTRMLKAVQRAHENGEWIIGVVHGIDGGDRAVRAEHLERHLAKVAEIKGLKVVTVEEGLKCLSDRGKRRSGAGRGA